MRLVSKGLLPAVLLLLCVSHSSADTYPTASQTFTFNKVCGGAGSSCYEKITFPLNIKQNAWAPPGSVRVHANLVQPYWSDLWIKFENSWGRIDYSRSQYDSRLWDPNKEVNGPFSQWTIWGDFTLWVGASGHGSTRETPLPAGVTDGVGYSVEITITYPLMGKVKPQSIFNAINKQSGHTILSAAFGDTIQYSGDDWDPKKGPIKVFLGPELIKRFPGKKSFSGKVRLPGWQRRDCTEVLKAVQGRVTRKIDLAARRFWRIEGVTKEYMPFRGRTLKRGDYLCEGDRVPECDPGQILVARSLVDRELSGFDGLGAWICGKQQTSWVSGLFTDKLRISNAGSKVTVSGGPTINAADWDPISRPDVNELPVFLNNPTLEGWQRSASTLNIGGNLRLNGALLYVAGDLNVGGTVTGVGTIVAAGEVTVGLPDRMRLHNDAAPGEVSTAVTIAAGNGLNF